MLLALGLWQLGQGLYIPAKAWLAQVLLEQAWARSRDTGHPVPPWPWADTGPVARLEVPRLQADEIVLAGTSGRTLAFGPGHEDGSAPVGSRGNAVLAGHRDTHFSFLRRLRRGDLIRLQPLSGPARNYRVDARVVVDQSAAWLADPAAGDRLTLVTCYPFDAILPGGALRYVVVALPAPSMGEGGTVARTPRRRM